MLRGFTPDSLHLIGVGNAFLLLDTVGRWTRWQGGCFPDEKHPFYFAQTKKKERL